MKQSAVMLEVMRGGPLARADLARRLDLSPASLTRLVAPLVEAGLVRETGTSVGKGAGRPSRPLDVVPEARRFVGVKVTGGAAHGVLVDLRLRCLRSLARPLPGSSPGDVVEVVAELVDELARDPAPDRQGVTGLGVSIGGAVVDGDVVTHAPFLDWSDVALGTSLADRTGLPAVVDNDVVALTKAEQWFGVGRSADRFVVLTVGAGVGYGLVVHDHVVEGVEAGVGILGHFPVDPQGAWCAEGHRGCAAVSLDSAAIARAASLGLGRAVEHAEVLELARRGDPVAVAVVEEAGRALGRLVAATSSVVMTDRVVLAGEGSGLAVVARRAMEEEARRGRHPRARDVEIEVRDTGDEQWACGAAVSAIQDWLRRPASRTQDRASGRPREKM